jgi:hypothetical protein
MIFTGSTMNEAECASSPAFTVPPLPSSETSHSRIAPINSLGQDPFTMIPRSIVAALCVLGPLTCIAYGGNINGEATYISFSVPGALGTYPTGINASMEVTGYYNPSPTMIRGFLREADGTITTFNVAGAAFTQPEGINAAGNITGFYNEQAGAAMKGFLRYADGRIITFAANQTNPFLGLAPVGINDFDEVAGNYTYHSITAFTRSRAGVFTTIAVPNGGGIATAINASGSVVGIYGGGNDVFTGFVAHPDGYWAQIGFPGNPACANQIIPDAINAAGTIAGFFTMSYYPEPGCSPESTGAFVMSPGGEVTLFQPPGQIPEFHNLAVMGFISAPHWISIDQAGDITGSYFDAAGFHGFVRNPYGTITSFDPPESKFTNVTSINDGGAIAGYYFYSGGVGPGVGFIRVP